jgi:hypothetical protein
VKFAFIAKHRGIWPAEWLTMRPRSMRRRSRSRRRISNGRTERRDDALAREAEPNWVQRVASMTAAPKHPPLVSLAPIRSVERFNEQRRNRGPSGDCH